MTLAEGATSDVQGLLLWTKPHAGGVFYPAGFITEVMAYGSRYVVPPAGTGALSLSNAVVVLAGGNLDSTFNEDVVFTPFNKVIPAPPNPQKLVLTISASSGLFSGSFLNPQTLRSSPIRGVLLQKQNAGAGYFLGTNQSGSVFLSEP
jgi:hypothetical protein